MTEQALKDDVLRLAAACGWPRIAWSTAAVISPYPGGEEAWRGRVAAMTHLALLDTRRLLERRLASRGTMLPAPGIAGAAPGAPYARPTRPTSPSQPAPSGPVPLPAAIAAPPPVTPGAARWAPVIKASMVRPASTAAVIQSWEDAKARQAEETKRAAAEAVARRTADDALAGGDPAAFRLLSGGQGPLARAQKASRERVVASMAQARKYLEEADTEEVARAAEAERLYRSVHRH